MFREAQVFREAQALREAQVSASDRMTHFVHRTKE